ncbi:MAG: hypothetical protein EOO54_28490, partial [Haliea sp.]
APTPLVFTLRNSNPVAIAGFSLTDVFPTAGGQPAIRIAAPTGAAPALQLAVTPVVSASAGATSLSATGTIPADGSCTFSVSVEAAQANGAYSTGSLTNRVNRSTQFGNDLGIAAAADATDTITVRSPLRVGKSVNASAVTSGGTGAFTITLYNDSASSALVLNGFTDDPIDGTTAGNTNAYGLKVTGQPTTTCTGATVATTANNTGIVMTGGTLAAGASCTVRIGFTGTVETANTPRPYTNTLPQGAVTVAGSPSIVSQAASAAVTVYENLNVSKSVSPNNAAPGQPVRYRVTVQNWSIAPITDLQINEQLTNGLTFLTGTIGGQNFTPSTACTGLNVTGGVGDTNVVFAGINVPARTSVNNPGSCVVTFWAMTPT